MKLLKTHPFLSLVNSYVIDSPSPSNISYLWNYGSLLGVVLVIQIATGVTLAMHYVPHVDLAFISVEHIMRDVNYGWMIRYFHANGAAFFFIFIYIHMAKGLYYGSYKAPRVMLWSIGVIIFLLLIITGFLGIQITCLKWLNGEIDLIVTNNFLMASSFIISPRLKEILSEKNIKPIITFEDLNNEEVKEKLRSETRYKSGIYGIFNLITKDFYIGSAVTNKFYSRFYKHLIKGLGNKNISIDLDKYGIESFAFIILEYFPEEITKKNNPDLMALETHWIKTYFPSYNILLEAGNSLGYKHTEETIQKMKDNFSESRKIRIGLLNKGKNLPESIKSLIRERALNKTEEIKNKYRLASYKSVRVYNQDGTIYMEFPGIYLMAKHFKCDYKTIKKVVNTDKLFKKQWYVKSDKINNPKN